ncbi:MAG: hypothetical protein KKA79_07295, partial [Nanoarchaeota archaeon]|nr:hypothetical protein [Nanoarchaeota archaeon]
MKFPKSFIPDKDLKNNIEKLIKEPKKNKTFSELGVEYLIQSCDEFLTDQKRKDMFAGRSIAKRIADEIIYTKQELEELSKRITVKKETDRQLGIYLSFLVNKIIKEKDIIKLTLKHELKYIGTKLSRGTLIVKGNVGKYSGWCMTGGELIIEGNAKSAGWFMRGGHYTLKGNAIGDVGAGMADGYITV